MITGVSTSAQLVATFLKGEKDTGEMNGNICFFTPEV
jgi:hypothetical protein